MHALLSINTLDPFLGRIDYASLSDQACMEILTAGLTLDQKRAFMILHSDTHDAYDYKDVCKWGCSECDEEGRVVQLTLFDYVGIPAASDQAYRLNLAYIPAKLKTFIIAQLKCESACNISDLPRDLERFHVRGTSLRGVFEVCQLPRSLIRCDISFNRFQGSCDISALPRMMLWLYANSNQLSGRLYFNNLPVTLEHLNLSYNNFGGTISLTSLPDSLRTLELSNNNFSGEWSMPCIPGSLESLNLSHNNLSGRVILLKSAIESQCDIDLRKNRIAAVVDESGKKHPFASEVLRHQIKGRK